MVIVAGHVIVGREKRDDYLDGCGPVVEQARSAPGCLDFAISADLLAVEAFRGSGPDDVQTVMIVSAAVSEYHVSGERGLT